MVLGFWDLILIPRDTRFEVFRLATLGMWTRYRRLQMRKKFLTFSGKFIKLRKNFWRVEKTLGNPEKTKVLQIDRQSSTKFFLMSEKFLQILNGFWKPGWKLVKLKRKSFRALTKFLELLRILKAQKLILGFSESSSTFLKGLKKFLKPRKNVWGPDWSAKLWEKFRRSQKNFWSSKKFLEILNGLANPSEND